MNLWADYHEYPHLGFGYFAEVRGDANFVVKHITNDTQDDGYMSDDLGFQKWCHQRLLRYGARSAEMRGLPLVFAVDVEHRMCEMARLINVKSEGWHGTWDERIPKWAQEHWERIEAKTGMGKGFGRALMPNVARVINRVFKGMRWDDHMANVMWCTVREQFIMNDPFSRIATSTGSPRSKRTASWKPKYGPNGRH